MTREVLKERFRLLLGEAAAGARESLHRAAAVSYSLGVRYQIPEAVEFFNALEDSTATPDWMEYLPDDIDMDMPVKDKCFECFYVRLCAAVMAEGVLQEALLLEAFEYLPDDVDVRKDDDVERILEDADRYREMTETLK